MQSPSGGTRPTGDGSQVKASLERENRQGRKRLRIQSQQGLDSFLKNLKKLKYS